MTDTGWQGAPHSKTAPSPPPPINKEMSQVGNMTSMSRICILGATSPIGIDLTDALCDKGYSLNVSYQSPGLTPSTWAEKSRLHPCWADLRDRESLLQACQGCNTVVWLIHAWQNRPGHCEDEFNAASLEWFCSVIARTNVKKLVFISSGGSVYGAPLFVPLTEDHPRNAVSSYGKTKKVMEDILLKYARQNGLGIAILRPGNVYGTSSLLTREHGIIGAYFRSLKENKPFPLVAQGKDVRDFIHISDMISAIELAILAQDMNMVWNIGTTIGIRIRDIVDKLQEIISAPAPRIVDLPARGSDVSVNILSTERIRQQTGWEAKVGIEEGLQLTKEMVADQIY